MKKVADDLQTLDICLDDGGHFADEQQISFRCLWPIIKTGGLYIIEDLHQAKKNMIDGFPCSIEFFESLDIKKTFHRCVDGFEKDICVLYKE